MIKRTQSVVEIPEEDEEESICWGCGEECDNAPIYVPLIDSPDEHVNATFCSDECEEDYMKSLEE